MNVALYAGAAVEPARAEAMAALGAIGFKLFTLAPAPGREREFDGLWATGDADVYRALSSVAETQLRCVIHAESDSLLGLFRAQANGAGRRPPAVEAVGIATTAAIAKEASAPIHIAHVSSRTALDAVRAGRELGADLTAETCPQYLLLDDRTVERFGGLAKIAPPLRTPRTVTRSGRRSRPGRSASSPATTPPSCHTRSSTWTSRWRRRACPRSSSSCPRSSTRPRGACSPLERAVGLVTAAPARLFGLETKGTLDVGADADVTLFSFDRARHTLTRMRSRRARAAAPSSSSRSSSGRGSRRRSSPATLSSRTAGSSASRRGRFLAGARVTVREPEPV